MKLKIRSFRFLIFLGLYGPGCGQIKPKTDPLINSIQNAKARTNLTNFINEKTWNALFPHRFGIGLKDSLNHNPDFYSFKSFVKAAKIFPLFLGEGNSTQQKRELAAFLANIAQETSGGWAEAPGGYNRWGLYFLEENLEGQKNNYIDSSKKKFPSSPGKKYFGRGPKQLSWNYNYAQFSQAWYGDMDTLIEFPERLSADPVLSFASAIWFWVNPQKPKPSCHDIMLGNWIPTDDDILKNRMPGFGATVNVINGGVECGTGIPSQKTNYRYAYYRYFCTYFGVDPGENINCDYQSPFGK